MSQIVPVRVARLTADNLEVGARFGRVHPALDIQWT
jgi:hypothetical protein